MPGSLLSVAFALLVAAHADTVPDPRAVVWRALRAVEGDSARAVALQWQAALRRDAADRAAVLGLATLARLTYDYPTAERLYGQLFASDSAAPDRYAAYARLGFAQGLEARSFGTAALAQFTRAQKVAHVVGDRTAEGEAFLWLTFSRGRLEGVGVAEVLLDSAERLIPDTALALRAECRNRRAIIYALRGQEDALAEADSSIATARRAGDLQAEASGFRVLGQVLQYRGQTDSALAVLRRAEDLYRRARDRSAAARSLIWQAQVLARMGQYGEMREVMQRALTEGEATHNPAPVGDAYRAFGVLSIMLGDFVAAADNLKRSEAISRETGDSTGVRTTHSFLADVALAAGDVAEARRLALEQLAPTQWAQPTDLYDAHRMLAAIAIREHDWAAADRALAKARTFLPQLPGLDYRQWLVHDEGRLALARGDLGAAERLFPTLPQVPRPGGRLPRSFRRPLAPGRRLCPAGPARARRAGDRDSLG
jgi:tetratricopeptide (TPR) repeat protein